MKLFFQRHLYNLLTLALAGVTYALCLLISAPIPSSAHADAVNEIQEAQAEEKTQVLPAPNKPTPYYVTLAAQSALQAYPNGVSTGGGWIWAPAYGFLYVGNWPWVYNLDASYWYYNEGTSSNLWMYVITTVDGRWMYTNITVYPWVHDSVAQEWTYKSPTPPLPVDDPQDEGETPDEEIISDINISPAGG